MGSDKDKEKPVVVVVAPKEKEKDPVPPPVVVVAAPDWERVAAYTDRLKVAGGYLYKYEVQSFAGISTTMTFVPVT